MKNINDLMAQIMALDIHEEDYDSYVSLLDLPRALYIQVMIGIAEGKIGPRDFQPILAKHREMIYSDSTTPDISLSDQLVSKFNGKSYTEALLKRDPTTEQLYIDEMGILMDDRPMTGQESEWRKIFVSDQNFRHFTLNYDQIELSTEDVLYMQLNGITEINMKKMKLLKDFILMTKPYKG